MKIEILGWKCKGLRAPDMEINLRPNNSTSKVSLILLDSGAGKTSLCQLIRLTLSGGIEKLKPAEILKFARPQNSKYLSDDGSFELAIGFNDETTVFEVLFDFKKQILELSTSRSGNRGKKPGYKPPLSATEFLNKKFVDLYIYDGEKAKQLLAEHSNEADLTIETINQLSWFDVIKDSVEDFFTKIKEESATNKAAQGQVTMLANKIRDLKARKKELLDIFKEKQKKLVKLNNDHQTLTAEKESVDDASQQAQAKLAELELAAQGNEALTNSILKDILSKLKQPHHLSKSIELEYINFRNNLEKLKIPEHSSSAFFEEISDEPICICDRPITPDIKSVILKNSKKYMGSSFTSFFDFMKSDVKNLILGGSNENFQLILESLDTRLAEEQKKLFQNKQDAENVKKNIKTSGGRTIQQIDAAIELLISEKTKINLFIEDYDKHDPSVDEKTRPDQIYSQRTLDIIIKSLQNEETLSKNLLNISNKIDDIYRLIDRCKQTAKDNIKANLIKIMNEKLASIITQDTIKVKELDDYIKLENRDSGSEGQNLAIAYIFLTVALNQARDSNQLPLLVDSPAGKIGQPIRENLAVMVPKNTSQFICLIQLGEREWFAKKLKDNAGPNPSFYTAFLKTKETEHYLNENIPNLIEYDNSAVVSGYEFLSQFSIPGSVGVEDV